jgi:hypothetical protein
VSTAIAILEIAVEHILLGVVEVGIAFPLEGTIEGAEAETAVVSLIGNHGAGDGLQEIV